MNSEDVLEERRRHERECAAEGQSIGKKLDGAGLFRRLRSTFAPAGRTAGPQSLEVPGPCSPGGPWGGGLATLLMFL